jgi:hypothetical protein
MVNGRVDVLKALAVPHGPFDWGHIVRIEIRKSGVTDLRQLVVCLKDFVELSGESWRGNLDRVR